jgi:histidinol phosphatase-like enzyme (inositol monophosphatase family)
MSTDSSWEAVGEVAARAGAVALAHFGRGLAVERKGDGSPVTIADRAAEEAARAWIAERFPADGILGEEGGAIRPEARSQWLIDPIDGTKSFVRGVPLWATLVARVEEGEPVAGALVFPALRETLVAARGRGCLWNGARCSVSSVARLAEAAVLITDERPLRPDHALWAALAREAALARTWGDAYGYLLVATGRAEVMADAIAAPWDLAAAQVAIEEAGGVFTDWRGRPGFAGGSGLATNLALATEVRSRLGAAPHGRVGPRAGAADRGGR